MLLAVNVQGKGCSSPDPAPPPPAASVPSPAVPGTYDNHLCSCTLPECAGSVLVAYLYQGTRGFVFSRVNIKVHIPISGFIVKEFPKPYAQGRPTEDHVDTDANLWPNLGCVRRRERVHLPVGLRQRHPEAHRELSDDPGASVGQQQLHHSSQRRTDQCR